MEAETTQLFDHPPPSCSVFSVHTQVFKKLAGKQGEGGGGAGGATKGGLEWPYSSRPSNVEKGARFAARLGLETAAGYALWELYKAVTAASSA